MNLPKQFNNAAQGRDGAGTIPQPSGPRNGSPPAGRASSRPDFNQSVTWGRPGPQATAPRANAPLTVEQAQAELKVLEDGRPKPEPRHEFKPPPDIAQFVTTAAEKEREARISSLRAFLEFREHRGNQDSQQAENDLSLQFS